MAEARPEDQPSGGRSARKRRAILDAATEVFLTAGYLGASMDEVAARSGVSKQTVYKHFADKDGLFVAVVTGAVEEISDPVRDEVLRLPQSEDLAPALQRLARRQLRAVMQPKLLRLRRLVIAESVRFPDLGRAFYERGPNRTVEALATAFEKMAAANTLRVDDSALAATHFNWLVMADPVNRAMLLGGEPPPTPAQLNRQADAGVRAFLAAYGVEGFRH